MLDAQVFKRAALIDAEQQLVGVDGLSLMLEARHLVLAAQQPACGAGAAVFGVLVGGGVFDTLVKRHGDGGAEVGLNLHTLLRSHKDAVTVKVGVEGHALLGDVAQLGKAEHLKPAAVGQNGTVPLRKLVQTAHLSHELVARTQVQMVGVAQHDLCADVLEVERRQPALDGRRRSDVLERGGLDSAVYRGKFTAARSPLLFDKAVRHRFYLHFQITCPEKGGAEGFFPAPPKSIL